MHTLIANTIGVGMLGPAHRENLMVNGNFDAGVTGWTIETDGTFVEETGIFYSGTASGKLTLGTTGNNVAQAVVTVVGKVYNYTAWVYLGPVTNSGYVYAAALPYAALISSDITTVVGSWQYLSGSFTAASTLTFIGVGLTADTGDIIYLDSVEVYKVT